MKIPRVTVIGAANIDVVGFPNKKLIYKDDVPGYLKTSIGGVGRNIAANLSKLGYDVEFLTILAKDDFGKKIKKSCRDLNISIRYSLEIQNAKTSTFLAIMNEDNNMVYGIAAMDIYTKIPSSFILDNLSVIKENVYCVLETNMPQSILDLVIEKSPNTLFFLDAVSGTKSLKAKGLLSKLHVLKCNLIEAELLSGVEVKEANYQLIISYFINQGVEKVFITLGSNGVVYGDASGFYHSKSTAILPINTSGGGDAFMAGLVLANNYSIHQMVKAATACAELTILHEETVHPKINKNLILKQIDA